MLCLWVELVHWMPRCKCWSGYFCYSYCHFPAIRDTQHFQFIFFFSVAHRENSLMRTTPCGMFIFCEGMPLFFYWNVFISSSISACFSLSTSRKIVQFIFFRIFPFSGFNLDDMVFSLNKGDKFISCGSSSNPKIVNLGNNHLISFLESSSTWGILGDSFISMKKFITWTPLIRTRHWVQNNEK